MYRSQDSETLDELRAENANLKEKLSERRRRRFEGFLNWAKEWSIYISMVLAGFGIIFSGVYHVYSAESEALDKGKRWRDAREPAGFLNCDMSRCRVYFEDRPPIDLNCSFDKGCMLSSDEK